MPRDDKNASCAEKPFFGSRDPKILGRWIKWVEVKGQESGGQEGVETVAYLWVHASYRQLVR